jgi:hypothetical protein
MASVLLITGSLIIGFIASDQQALYQAFYNRYVQRILAIFLLDIIVSGRKLNDFFQSGWFSFSLQSHPLINGIVVPHLNHLITDDIGNRFIFVLASSASTLLYPRR